MTTDPIGYSCVEVLEARIAPATITVTNLTDHDAGSLRDAITQAETQAGADKIVFQKGLTGEILLSSDLPEITEALSITGPGLAKVSINGGGNHIFNINSSTSQNFTIASLSLKNGLAGAGGAITIHDPNGKVLIQK